MELTHLYFPVALSCWENQIPHPLVVFELGNSEKNQSLGLSLQKGDHLGPHRDDCHSNTSGRESRRQVRLRECEEGTEVGLMHNELVESIDENSDGSGNHISILKTLAFLS